MIDYGHWKIPFEFNPDEYFGFVYLIENTTNGKQYIGQKKFRNNRGQYNFWLNYIGSSVDLKEDMRLLKGTFTFNILSLHTTFEELQFAERDLQIKKNVLYSLLENGERKYYNRCIFTIGFVNMHGKPDNTIYTVKNMKSGEKIIGTQMYIREKIKLAGSIMSELIHSDKHYYNGWALCVSDGAPMTNTIDKRISVIGNDHHNSDPNIYSIKNIYTNEKIIGTRHDIRTKSGLNLDESCKLILSGYCKGWEIIPPYSGIECNTNFRHKSDPTVYEIQNTKSKEIISGTKSEIKIKLNCTSSYVGSIIKGEIYKGWQKLPTVKEII